MEVILDFYEDLPVECEKCGELPQAYGPLTPFWLRGYDEERDLLTYRCHGCNAPVYKHPRDYRPSLKAAG